MSGKMKDIGKERPKLYLMCGVPASGKSYFAEKHMDEEKDVYISRDQVRFEMVPETDEYFSREKEVYEEWIKRIAWALNAGFNVWADATHLNKKSRAKTFHALTKKGIDFVSIEVMALVMDTPFLVCMERNSKRSGRYRVPASAMRRMVNSFHKPDEEEKWIDTVYIIPYEERSK